MKNLLLVITFIFIGAALNVLGQSQKEQVIRAAKALETAPLSGDTAKLVQPALKWTIETDEVHLIACGAVFSPIIDKKNKNGAHMTSGYMLGMAAFKLQNPEKASDEDAAQFAGVDLALKVYEAAVREKPKTRNDKIEELIAKRASGTLQQFVNSAQCGKK